MQHELSHLQVHHAASVVAECVAAAPVVAACCGSGGAALGAETADSAAPSCSVASDISAQL